MLDFFRHPPGWMVLVLWASLVIVLVRILWFALPALPSFIKLRTVGVPVSFFDVIGMQLRSGRSGMRTVTNAAFMGGRKLDVPLSELEAHHLAGGDVAQAVLIQERVRKSHLGLTWKEITHLQLSGQELYKAVMEAADGKPELLDKLRAQVRPEPTVGQA